MKRLLVLHLILILILFTAGCKIEISNELSPYDNLNPTSDITLSVNKINSQKKQLTLLLTNETLTELSCDGTYSLEENRDGNWYVLNAEQYFNAIGYILEPKMTSKMIVTWENELSDGEYRIIKPIFINGDTEYFSVSFKLGK